MGLDDRDLEYDSESGVYRMSHDWAAPESLSSAVLTAVSAAADCEPVELPPLYEQVDPACLEGLFSPEPGSQRRNGSVTFALGEFHVTVAADGEIVVYPPAASENG